MNISTLVPKTTKITAAAVGVVLAGSLMMVPAEAEAGPWHTRGEKGEKGAHAQGQASRKNGRSYINGYVKDTACDDHSSAHLYIQFGGTFPREESVRASQCGAVTPFSFNSQHRPVEVRECIIGKFYRCGRWITVIR
jgi:hypothetical protein